MQRNVHDSVDEQDMEIAAVSDDGRVIIRFFGGSSIELAIPSQLVPYYRRLLRSSAR